MRAVLVSFGFGAAILVGCSTPDKGVTIHNSAPGATIINPVEGSLSDTDATIDFVGIVDDAQTPAENLSVIWTSDIDGSLSEDATADSSGRTQFSTSMLSADTHTIVLTVVDEGGLNGQASVQIVVEDAVQPPSITVRSPDPEEGSEGVEGVPFPFEALVSDPQDAPTLLDVDVELESGEAVCSAPADIDGIATCSAELEVGNHRVIFTVVDTDGNRDQASAMLEIMSASTVDNDGDGISEVDGDCDDTDEDVHPGAIEFENGEDDDCDGRIDNDTDAFDDDSDGYTERAGDCDDYDATIRPGALEYCDGIDTDCDGEADDSDVVDGSVYYRDLDGDGHGDPLASTHACELPEGYADNGDDCNDTDSGTYPGAEEVCDGADNDCNGFSDEEGASGCSTWYRDGDRDGYGTTDSQCTCASASPYDSSLSTDCYDSNPSAKPEATGFYEADRGDGSHDYNCDTIEEKQYTDTSGDCSFFGGGLGCVAEAGWDGGVPACGVVGSWKSDCSMGWGCSWDDSTDLTQACR